MKPKSRENILREIAEVKQQIAHLRKQQEEAEITLQSLNEYLSQYDKEKTHPATTPSADSIPVAAKMSPRDKIVLFRCLFRGREDMHPKERSTFKKLSQNFDEKTNEHVIVIEYRVRVKGTVKSTPRKQTGNQQMAFLRQLVAAQGKTQ
jgi:hypothetical protein